MSAKLQDVGLLALRVGVGLTLAYYGAQKLLGVFGGFGFLPTIEAFERDLGVPRWLGALAVFAEFFGGLGLVFGALTRLAAFGAVCTMAVATFIKARPEALRNMVAPQEGVSAVEVASDVFFPFVLLAGSLAILLIGAGQLSLDAAFLGKGRGRK
ncbi:MAG: DoxX family protein [Fimbriimonadales bacterium]|nr:DoxX family protein [Fimbriimonadales bacterium]